MVEALAKLDRGAQRRAVARLAADLRDLESARAFEATWLLPLLADGASTAVAALLDQSDAGDARRKLVALFLLAQYGEQATPAAPGLVRFITQRDSDRRIDLVLAFDWGELADPGGGYELFRRMYPDLGNPGETSVVALCVRALKAMGESVEHRAIRDLIAVLEDPDRADDGKRGAIAALGEFGSEAAEPALRAAARNDTSPEIRDHASAVLRAITGGRARR